MVEFIVGGRLAIRNTVRLRETISHARPWGSRDMGGDDPIE
jgi:hypothetical protein